MPYCAHMDTGMQCAIDDRRLSQREGIYSVIICCAVRQIVKAFCVLNADYQEHDRQQLVLDLQKYVQTNTAPYKYPRKVRRSRQFLLLSLYVRTGS